MNLLKIFAENPTLVLVGTEEQCKKKIVQLVAQCHRSGYVNQTLNLTMNDKSFGLLQALLEAYPNNFEYVRMSDLGNWIMSSGQVRSFDGKSENDLICKIRGPQSGLTIINDFNKFTETAIDHAAMCTRLNPSKMVITFYEDDNNICNSETVRKIKKVVGHSKVAFRYLRG